MGNQVAVGVSGYGEFKGQLADGSLRILAVSGDQRIAGVNAPTLKEAGVNVELTNWRGLVGAPGMPDNARQAWIQMLTQMHGSTAWKDTMLKTDWADAFLTGDPYAQFLRQEDDRVGKILKDIGLVQ